MKSIVRLEEGAKFDSSFFCLDEVSNKLAMCCLPIVPASILPGSTLLCDQGQFGEYLGSLACQCSGESIEDGHCVLLPSD